MTDAVRSEVEIETRANVRRDGSEQNVLFRPLYGNGNVTQSSEGNGRTVNESELNKRPGQS